MDLRRTSSFRLPAALVVAALGGAPPARGQVTTRVSVRADGVQSEHDCTAWDLSHDGRYVLFSSRSILLVPGTLTQHEHAFVADRATGAIELVSSGDGGVEANDDVTDLRISADGRYVVFASRATNLAADDVNGVSDCFLRDRAAGITHRVSLGPDGEEGNRDSTQPVVSADGQRVLFTTASDNFDLDDFNEETDVYLRNRSNYTTALVSAAANGKPAAGYSQANDLSPDGRFAVFLGDARDIVAGDPGWQKVFVRDMSTGTTEIASLAWNGAFVQGDCWDGRCSADGNEIVFTSQDQTIVPNDSNARTDIFLRDRAAATTVRVNVGPNGEQDDVGADYGSISDDGRVVGFASSATTLDPADVNTNGDAYARDRLRDRIARVSVTSDGHGSKIGANHAIVSPDGHCFAFASIADEFDPDDRNGRFDVFVRELAPTRGTSLHYGAGFPGKNGVPTIEIAADPVLGEPIDLAFSNSYGRWTLGFLVVGDAAIDVECSWGGDLLASVLLLIPIPLPTDGYVLHDELPFDPSLWGSAAFLQALTLDPGAARGISATDGLELRFGF